MILETSKKGKKSSTGRANPWTMAWAWWLVPSLPHRPVKVGSTELGGLEWQSNFHQHCVVVCRFVCLSRNHSLIMVIEMDIQRWNNSPESRRSKPKWPSSLGWSIFSGFPYYFRFAKLGRLWTFRGFFFIDSWPGRDSWRPKHTNRSATGGAWHEFSAALIVIVIDRHFPPKFRKLI